MVENFLLKSNLSLLNSGSPTYLHPATASSSAIDLSITHPALYLDFCWQTDSDLHGSDWPLSNSYHYRYTFTIFFYTYLEAA